MSQLQSGLALLSIALLLALAALPHRSGKPSAIIRNGMGGIVVPPLVLTSLALGISLMVSSISGR